MMSPDCKLGKLAREIQLRDYPANDYMALLTVLGKLFPDVQKIETSTTISNYYDGIQRQLALGHFRSLKYLQPPGSRYEVDRYNMVAKSVCKDWKIFI
jgi:hypothetical protein